MLLQRTLLAAVLLSLAGCVSDDLAVYEDTVVKGDAAKAFVGTYEVDKWPGNSTPDKVTVSTKDDKLRLSYDVSGKHFDVQFVLSKIPKSKKGLYLLGIPKQEGNKGHLFFLARRDKETSSIWIVHGSTPAAIGRLAFTSGKASADDVKRFMTKHADELVTQVEADVKLTNPRR